MLRESTGRGTCCGYTTDIEASDRDATDRESPSTSGISRSVDMTRRCRRAAVTGVVSLGCKEVCDAAFESTGLRVDEDPSGLCCQQLRWAGGAWRVTTLNVMGVSSG